MAAPFYSRYVPGSTPAVPGSPDQNNASLPQKRKRETDGDATPDSPKKSSKSEKQSKKKDRNTGVPDLDAAEKKKKRRSSDGKQNGVDEGAQTDAQDADEEVRVAGRDIPSEQGAAGKTESGGPDEDAGDRLKEAQEAKGRKREKRTIEDNIINPEGRASTKHARIISKFEKSKTKAQQAAKSQPEETTESESDEEIESHGLVPLPQPAPAPESKELPSYSTLPSWLAAPYYVSPGLKRDFTALDIDQKTIAALEGKGFTEAFPIQSAVMNLVAQGQDYHEGDICISAATGSGKTLAYALPLVRGIESSPVSRLRGLIVVPTRELVTQAREACELCATGTGLRIGTAVGTTALKEEQQQLMTQNQVYDPVSYRRRNEKAMGADDWAKFSFQDYLADAEEFQASLPGHLPQSSPNVDILICTPGRLVDHIRSTKGFTLEHVQFLIIDEADRLLNESFQEWVETVMPAFESKQSIETRGSAQSFLQKLGKSMSRPSLRKIILSATMTRDITKLNSLRLQNPKLVVMHDKEANAGADQDVDMVDASDNNYRLPAKLSEAYCPAGDGSEKPLYLLQLLLEHLKIGVGSKQPTSRRQRSASVSSGNSTSSEGSSDTDSDSDSDSASSVSSDSSASTSTSASTPPEDTNPRSTALIFTKSSESAARLSRLLSLLHPPLSSSIGTLTKSSNSSASRRTLSSYRQGKTSIIVATDRASRGLDLSGLGHVISYDVPASVTSYVHRIGRTARAGRAGCAWTLVAHREGRWWRSDIMKGPIEKIGGERAVRKVALEISDESGMKERYAKALGELEKQVAESTRRPVESTK